MANHIVPLILEKIRSEVEQICMTDVPYGDPSRLKIVKIGRFQVDPAEGELRASVQGGDLEDIKLLDGLFSSVDAQERLGFNLPSREIGGTQMWIRRGTIRLELYFIIKQKPEETSRELAYTILGRIQQHLESINVSRLRDDFGEHAIKLFSTQDYIYQSGGPPSSYIWRGAIVWECLTERNFDDD